MFECLNNTDDEIAKALFKEDGFMILKTGLRPSELAPGDIARRRFKHKQTRPIFDKADNLFDRPYRGTIGSGAYPRLGRSATTKQTVKAAVSLAKVLTTASVPSSKVKAALDRMRVTELDINLAGCKRLSISQGEAEAAFRKITLNDVGRAYLDEGQSFYLVLETIQANGAYLAKADRSEMKTGIDFDVEEWAEIGFAFDQATSTGHQIHMRRISEPVVVAFQAVELIRDNRAGFWFRGLENTILQNRGENASAENLALERGGRTIQLASLADFGIDTELLIRTEDESEN
ncbi:hypothetical protein [Neorhizobium tomejilense]|uniref:hypothetical protein n=1 Tax=Neorhizobium tomejilense TaxID=2093828 RepID=UPI003ECCBDC8